MKSFRMLLTLTAAVANLVSRSSVLAADAPSSPPTTVVPQNRDDRDLQRDLSGVPDNIKNLILTFDQTRDKFLQQQNLLKIKLLHASTPSEQEQIRQQLQANRQEFMNN